jgi:Crinkler effector protein N-terminal domain
MFGTKLPSHILSIEISGTDDFSKLRKLIKDDNSALLGCFDMLDLTLWKVSLPPTLQSYEKLSSLSLDDISTIGIELDSMSEISSEFDQKLDRKQLHIIVQPPGKLISPF